MPVNEPLDLAQPENTLSLVAEAQRKLLFPKNDYKRTANEYSAVNPDALATGDAQGKGTGGDLDIFNESAGAIQDILERKSEILFNQFKSNAPYTTPSA
jgi:muramoyltetrapeptide carboxypeptidase LdcA involved in peptidoglycan recycling